MRGQLIVSVSGIRDNTREQARAFAAEMDRREIPLSLLVAPRPGGGLTSAKSAYETPYGTAVSDWSISAGKLTLRVTIPAGASATVRVPTSQPGSVTAPPEAVPSTPGTYFLPAGSYVFTAPA